MKHKAPSCSLWSWEETHSQIASSVLSGGQDTHSASFDIGVPPVSGSNHLLGSVAFEKSLIAVSLWIGGEKD